MRATHILISLWIWCLFLLDLVLLTGTLIAQVHLLEPRDPRQPRWLRSGLKLPKWFVRPVVNVLQHARTVGGLLDLSLYYAASAIAGAVTVYYFISLLGSKGAGGSWLYGIVLGGLHAIVVVAGGRNTLLFPIIHQQRIFAIKKELLKAVPVAAVLPLIAIAVTAVLRFTLMSGHGSQWALRDVVVSLVAGCCTVFCFYMGTSLLSIVVIEHLRFALPGDSDPNGKLYAILQNDKDPVWQSLALQDLSFLSHQGPSEQWRRAAIFSDVSGNAWKIPVQFCLTEVESLAKQVAAVLPQPGAQPGEAGPESHAAPKWNVHPISTKPLGGVGHAQEEAAWYMRSRCWRTLQCIRVLASLSIASHTEDRLGTAQLSQPNIGTITATLGSLVLALQAYAKTCMAAAPRGSALTQQSMGPDAPGGKRSRNAGAPGFALHDAALAALYGILGAFGSEVIPVVRSSKTQLPFGTTADVVALLTRCSTYSE
ncbi:g7254 [Coccomyxa elongata]